MKKLMTVIALVFAVSAFAEFSAYLEKPVETKSGAVGTCIRITSIDLRLEQNKALVRYNIYKDVDSYLAKKDKLDSGEIWISDLDKLAVYETAFAEVLQKLMQDEKLKNATLKTKEIR